jgi:hypothetical protein
MRMKLNALHALLGVTLALTACDDGTQESTAAVPPSATASSQAKGAPKIVAVDPVFEFGKVKLGDSVEHVFKVKNTGTAALEITRAKGS